MSDGTTHWVGCWTERGHHECALAEIDRLAVALLEARSELSFRRLVAGDAGKECDRLRADLSRVESERDRLRDALVQVERVVHMCRIWGGMDWSYHAAPRFRVEALAKLCEAALAHPNPEKE